MHRRVVYLGFPVVVALALSSLFLINPHPKTEAQRTTACCGANPPTAPRQIVFPYYSWLAHRLIFGLCDSRRERSECILTPLPGWWGLRCFRGWRRGGFCLCGQQS